MPYRPPQSQVPPSWDALHQLSFVFEDGCWSTCGGHCCKSDSPDLAFALLGTGAGMVFFEGEFDFLREKGVLQEGFLERAKLWKFPFGDGQEARFWISKCNLGGRCTLPGYRPLLCKVYPYLPRVDLATGAIGGFIQAAVFDQFWTHLGKQNPCTLVRERPEQTQKAALPALEQPGVGYLQLRPRRFDRHGRPAQRARGRARGSGRSRQSDPREFCYPPEDRGILAHRNGR